MHRLSILSLMHLVALCAMIIAPIVRLREEAFCYSTGPLLEAGIAASAYRAIGQLSSLAEFSADDAKA